MNANTEVIIIGLAGFLILVSIVVFLMISYQRKMWQEQNKLQHFKLEQQKKLMKAVIETQERERERIAQDLHDEIGALAISLKVNNDSISDHTNNTEQLKAIQKKNEVLANKIIRTGRHVSHDLLPPIIKKCGLIEALMVLTEDMNNPSNTAVEFNSNLDHVKMDTIAEISIYRVMKEWMHNVMKHAEASLLKITVNANDHNVTILAEDNGKDFNFEREKERSQGLGLMNIEGRLNHLNARFWFAKNNGKGTVLTIEYPLN